MEKLKFGIDVDGVLRNLSEHILKIYNAEFGGRLTMDQFVYYDVNDMFPDIRDAYKYFFTGENAARLLRDSEQVDGALDAFNVLNEIGTAYIITSQTGFDNISHTLYWLRKNGFDTDQVCFVKDKSVISGLDYFIDDNPDKFIGVNAAHGILIDMPYNRRDMSETLRKTKCGTFERFADLASFTENLIKKLK